MEAGRVETIVLRTEEGGGARAVDRVRAVAGRGLEGDHLFAAAEPLREGEAITLIEAEALEWLAAEHGIALAPAEARRNVVTRGIGLNDLVGRRFRVGEVECAGTELCEPCRTLERRTEPGVLRALVHRGGLRADLLSDGEIRAGDPVEALA